MVFWYDGEAAYTDSIDSSLASAQGDEKAALQKIKSMIDLWGADAPQFERYVGGLFYDSGRLNRVYTGSFGYENSARENKNNLQRCSAEIEVEVEIGSPNRVEINYGLGHHFYVETEKGGYTLARPEQPAMGKFISTYRGTHGMRLGDDKVPSEIDKRTKDIIKSILAEMDRT